MSSRRIAGLSVLAPTETSVENCYETPLWLVERIRATFDQYGRSGIELDPCTTPQNPCRANRFYTPADDGILQPWDAQTIYVNPPYGRTIAHWIGKAIDASVAGSSVILLLPSRSCSRWFHDALRASRSAIFLKGRLRFGSTQNSAPFPSVLIGLNVSLQGLADLGAQVMVL